MDDQRRANKTESAAVQPAQRATAPQAPNVPIKDSPAEAKPLTPEEQMALYEEKLKEDDWGHQPC